MQLEARKLIFDIQSAVDLLKEFTTNFRRPGIDELINIQRDGSNAKPYQVRQIRAVPGGCPRTATVARTRLIESYFLVI